MARKRAKRRIKVILGLSLLAAGLFALAGVRVAEMTFAAASNPYGSIDYCALENNTTVIYGWAADPDAVSLAQPQVTLNVGNAVVTALTNRSGYRDAAIESWIDFNRTGDPKLGTYGFRVAVPGLTKGNKYPVSGTALNEGGGANVVLSVNTSTNTDNDKTKPFFASSLVPDACLADPAATATPPVTAKLPDPKVAASDATGATVTTGTMAAQLAIKTDSTATVRVTYGTDAQNLTLSSSDQLTTGAQTSIILTGLTPATRYNYRVARTDLTGKVTTSPLGTFDALGYVAAIHFVDSRDVGIQGISAQLDAQTKAKVSDDGGTVQFTDITNGTHTVQFSYHDKNFSKTITADASTVPPATAAAPQVMTLDNTLDIQALLATKTTPVIKRKPNTTLIALAIAVLVVIVLGVVIGLLVRALKKRKELDDAWQDTPAPPLPEYKPLGPSLPPVAPTPGAEHMGKSLKDMVGKDLGDGNSHQNPPGTPD